MFELKEKPEERQSIILLDYHSRRMLVMDPKEFHIDEKLPVLLIDVDELGKRSDIPFVKNIKSSGLMVPGNILIQNPHDSDIYFKASEAPINISKSKIMCYQTFFSFLGAKSFKFKKFKSISETINKEFSFKGETRYKMDESSAVESSAECDIKEKIENLLEKELSISVHYSGASPDIEEAEEWLRKKRLYNDVILQNLFESFKNMKNPMEKFEIKIRLLEEVNRVFSILGELNLSVLPVFSADIRAGYNKLFKSKIDFFVTFEVLWK